MSKYFVVDHRDSKDFEHLDMPRASLHWMLEVIAENVDDPAIVAEIAQCVEGNFVDFALSYLSDEQAVEVVAAIRGPLLVAARDEHPFLLGLVEELVEMTTRWGEARSA